MFCRRPTNLINQITNGNGCPLVLALKKPTLHHLRSTVGQHPEVICFNISPPITFSMLTTQNDIEETEGDERIATDTLELFAGNRSE